MDAQTRTLTGKPPTGRRRPGAGKLVLSYNVNSFTLSDLYANINNNRARFITVDFANH